MMKRAHHRAQELYRHVTNPVARRLNEIKQRIL